MKIFLSPSKNTLIGEKEPAVPPFSFLICSIKLLIIYEALESSIGVYELCPDTNKENISWNEFTPNTYKKNFTNQLMWLPIQ